MATTDSTSLSALWSTWASALTTFVALLVALYAARFMYSLYFHPLAKFPGSKLAAFSTPWYEWYWNVHKPGQMLFEIERLHNQHGPVVRTGVNELHVNDPDYYIASTNTSTTFLKDPVFYAAIGFPHATLGMIDPEEHRVRKQVLAAAFSPSNVQDLSPRIQARVNDMCQRLEKYAETGKPANIYTALKAYAMDVIYLVALGKDWGALKKDDFHHPMNEIMKEALKGAWIPRAFPVMSQLILSLPHWAIKLVVAVPMIAVGMAARSGLDDYMKDREEGKLVPITAPLRQKQDDGSEPRLISNIVERLLDPKSAKGYKPLCMDHINEEVLMSIAAGNDTTSTAMIDGLYQICKRPEMVRRLQAELDAAFPDASTISYTRAKQLPYLNAVSKETMRWSSSIPGRLPRVIPDGGIVVQGQMIPAGTIVHTSPWLSNRHPAIWGENAYEFDPERWLNADLIHLDKYHATHHRGSRVCVGVVLAYCEMYLLYANLFRRFDITIYNTSDEDMQWTDHSFKVFAGKELEILVRKRA